MERLQFKNCNTPLMSSDEVKQITSDGCRQILLNFHMFFLINEFFGESADDSERQNAGNKTN